MNLQQLGLEELENINGGLVPVEPAEGARPSGENSWGAVIDWALRGYEIYKLFRP